MFFKSEDSPVVKANSFEDSIAIKQTMIEHGNLRVSFRVEFSVDVDLRFLDAGCPPRPTFDCGFDYCLGTGLVDSHHFLATQIQIRGEAVRASGARVGLFGSHSYHGPGYTCVAVAGDR